MFGGGLFECSHFKNVATRTTCLKIVKLLPELTDIFCLSVSLLVPVSLECGIFICLLIILIAKKKIEISSSGLLTKNLG